MATTDARIFRINDYIANINAAQIAVEPANDADLGYRMYGGKDAAGNVQKWLAKDKPIRAESLGLIGTDYIGEAGLLRHDTNGDVVGKQMTVAELNSMLSDGPIGGTVNLPDGEIAYGGGVGGLNSDEDFKWDDTNQSIRAGTNSVATGTNSFALGNEAAATGNYSIAQGVQATASGAAASARGASCNASKDYSTVRGNGPTSVWKGGRHFSGGRLNGEYSSQGMDGLILQARTTDDTTTVMKFAVADADSPLFCPDECIQVYTVDLLYASDQAGAGEKEGFLWTQFPVVVMRNDPDFNAYYISSLGQVMQARGDGVTLGSFGIGIDDTEKTVEIEIAGHASPHTTINWVAHVRAAIQTHTDYYVGGTGG